MSEISIPGCFAEMIIFDYGRTYMIEKPTISSPTRSPS